MSNINQNLSPLALAIKCYSGFSICGLDDNKLSEIKSTILFGESEVNSFRPEYHLDKLMDILFEHIDLDGGQSQFVHHNENFYNSIICCDWDSSYQIMKWAAPIYHISENIKEIISRYSDQFGSDIASNAHILSDDDCMLLREYLCYIMIFALNAAKFYEFKSPRNFLKLNKFCDQCLNDSVFNHDPYIEGGKLATSPFYVSCVNLCGILTISDGKSINSCFREKLIEFQSNYLHKLLCIPYAIMQGHVYTFYREWFHIAKSKGYNINSIDDALCVVSGVANSVYPLTELDLPLSIFELFSRDLSPSPDWAFKYPQSNDFNNITL